MMLARILAAAIAGFACGCTGTIENGSGPGGTVIPEPGGSGGAGMGTGGSKGGGGEGGMAEPPGAGTPGKVCGTYPKAVPGAGPAPMRRLTRSEYDNTVADLLGDTSKPSTSFPVDLRSASGFDNDASLQSVTGQLAEDYFDASDSLAVRAVGNTKVFPACAPGGEETCARTFITDLGKRAHRRPLDAEDVTSYMGLYTASRAAGDAHSVAMKNVLSSILQSPYFIYRPEFGEQVGGAGLTSWEMASRISYLVWGSMPDTDLFAAAEANALRAPAQIKAQVERMLTSARTHAQVARFHDQMLRLAKLDSTSKDAKLFPDYAAVRPNMKEETTRFLERGFWQGDGAAQGLFTATTSFLTPELAKFIGMPSTVTQAMKPGFQSVALNPAQRMGLLTQAGFLAAYAKPNDTLPVVRGKFVMEQLLCKTAPPPPANVENNVPAPSPSMSTRERFALHLQAECASCHKLMDPIGFAFENFDAAGRWRTTDGGKPVDASGTIGSGLIGGGTDGAFTNAVDLSNIVAASPEMKKCFATQWLRFALGRDEVGQDERSLEQLFCAFEQANFNLRDLLAGVAQTDSFLGRPGGAR